MNTSLEQQQVIDDANARTFVCVLLAAYLRHLNPTLSYCESLAYSRAMPMDERIAILVAAATEKKYRMLNSKRAEQQK